MYNYLYLNLIPDLFNQDFSPRNSWNIVESGIKHP